MRWDDGTKVRWEILIAKREKYWLWEKEQKVNSFVLWFSMVAWQSCCNIKGVKNCIEAWSNAELLWI